MFYNNVEDRTFVSKREGNYDIVNNNAFYYNLSMYPYIDNYLLAHNKMKKIIWPNDKKFAVCLTHDVDTLGLKNIQEPLRRLFAIKIPKNKTQILHFLNSFYKIYKSFKCKKTRGYDFNKYCKIEEKFNAKSTYFIFISDVKGLNPTADCYYRLQDKIVFDNKNIEFIDLLKKLKEDGYEIGLHPSVNSYKNKKILSEQKKILEETIGCTIESIRQHYLMYEADVTSIIQNEVGFKFDSTYGFNNSVGFRAGTSYPFKINGVLELPLHIQDGALFRANGGLGLNKEKAIKVSKNIIDRVKSVGGIVTLLWHPNADVKDKDIWDEVYAELIEYLSLSGAYFGTVSEVATICEKQTINLSNMDIEIKDYKDFIHYMKGQEI